MPIVDVKLEDKYVLNRGRAFMTGFQALVRLPMMQRQRDLAAGLDTAGFVSGYPGSPISALDTEMKRAERFLKEHHVEFQPGLNEDLAATAVWGTQQVNSFRGARYDGVFAMWFGKGPGVDRTGDVFVHGNTAGTSPHGGVLAIAGDDHAARTTTTPHQSELIFASHQMPVLNPATSQDFLDLGLHGWALSRYSGLWVGFLTGCDNVERSGSLYLDPHRVEIRIPDDFEMPGGGLSIRWPYPTLQRESTVKEHSLFAALAYARANKLNRVVVDSHAPRFGVAATGKSYTDLREAMGLLGIDDTYADELGLRVFRIDMTWPLEPQGVVEFARGLEEVLVIEEKRPFVETQIKEQLFNWDQAGRPRVIGKYDGHGEWEGPANDWLLPSTGELDPVLIARILADRIARFRKSPRIDEAVARLDARDKALEAARRIETHGQTKTMFTAGRLPYFCSGCPHNTSTKVPEGSRALAGIGLPLHGHVDEPQHHPFQPNGRRGGGLDRPKPVYGRAPRLCQSRRRHVRPFRADRDSRRGGRWRQHHLQNPAQWRDFNDRRPGAADGTDGGSNFPPTLSRGRRDDRRRLGRTRQVSGRIEICTRRDHPASPRA